MPLYPLVQTVLVQDEALKRADEQIRELEAALGQDGTAPQGGFLENMRDTLFGGREQSRGSVPSVRPAGAPMGAPPGFRTGAPAAPLWRAPAAFGRPGRLVPRHRRRGRGRRHRRRNDDAGHARNVRRPAAGRLRRALIPRQAVAAPRLASGDVSGDLARQVRLDDMVGGRTSDSDDNKGKGKDLACSTRPMTLTRRRGLRRRF